MVAVEDGAAAMPATAAGMQEWMDAADVGGGGGLILDWV